jgi:hypothetical protein
VIEQHVKVRDLHGLRVLPRVLHDYARSNLEAVDQVCRALSNQAGG